MGMLNRLKSQSLGGAGWRVLTLVGLLSLLPAAQGATTQTRTSAFDYDTASGLLIKEVVEPGNSALCVVTTYTIDAVGNRTGSTTRNCNGSAGNYSGASTEAAAPTGNAGYTGTPTPTPTLTDVAPFTPRSTSTTYTTDKRFVATVSNALSQTETRTYDSKLGVVLSLTGPNGLTTYWAYDDFGRKILEKRPDDKGTQWAYQYCSGFNGGTLTCPTINGAVGAYAITTTPVVSVNIAAKTAGAANGPYVRVYYDTLGREIRTETQGDDSAAASKLIYADVKYNALGQVYQKSAPYFSGGTAYWTTYTYDLLGRVITEDRPTDTASSGATSTITYSGLITTTTVKVNASITQQTKEERNYVGQVVKITDAKGGTLTRDYDPFGNLVRTTDAAGNVTSLEYDIKGRKTKMYDPDMGVWTYAYNALGELRKQKDAKAQLTEMAYDQLGRMIKRGEPGLTSTWTYDKYVIDGTGPSTCTKGVGKLCEVSATNNYSRKHVYDGYGRPSTTTTTVDTKVLTASVAYDSNGRISSQTYPASVSVSNVYSPLGYLKQVKDARTGGATLWTASANRNALGQLLSYQYGNGVSTTNGYYAPTGRLNTTQSGTGNAVQNLSHSYNYIGGLTQRVDVLTGVTASYGYDELNRLLNETRSGGGLPSAQVISWTYNAIGNMITRTESGATNTYNYNTSGSGSLRPHAVANVSGTVNGYAAPIYAYDGNGNLTSGGGRTVTWTSYDKVETITKGATTLTYKYDSEHERSQEVYKLNGVAQRTTTYLNPGAGAGLFYEEEKNELSTVVKKKFYVSAPSGTIALITCTVADCSLPANTTTQYWHKDHLGSTSVITNAAGAVIERMAYEPFGKRRNSNGVTDANGTLVATNTDRGFTGHEHMEEVGLINMNGRVFDPGLGRFMSADPIIQSPGALQSYNRYSYVWNDPLNSTDPTGYKKMWQQKWFRQVVSIAVAAYIGVYLEPFSAASLGSIGAGMANGALAGFASGAISSGNIKGAFQGAVSGAMFGGIGGMDLSAGWAIAAHAAAGCASAELGGGDCGQGALAAGLSKAAFIAAPEWIKNPTTSGEMDWGKVAGGAAYSAVVGGTASVLGGGKFANGAQMAAFAYIVNGTMTVKRGLAAVSPAGAANAPGQTPIDATNNDLVAVASVAAENLLPGGDLIACSFRQCSGGEIAQAAAGLVPAGKAGALIFKAHSLKRLSNVGLNVQQVESAVAADIVKIPSGSLSTGADFSNRLMVQDIPVIYRARLLPDGKVNVGSIHPDDMRWKK